MSEHNYPQKQGLYDPQFEHDSCGVGFVCNINGEKSNTIIRQALEVLNRLAHRGAVGADPDTGDGAGLLIQIPHDYFSMVAQDSGVDLPPSGKYGTGLIFLPTDNQERKLCKDTFARIIEQEGQILLGWRTLPVDNSVIGKSARDTKPVIEQVFIGRNKDIQDPLDFERKLYVIRRQIENIVLGLSLRQSSFFYITNLSSRTFSYKGLLMPHQVEDFFIDLQDERLTSSLALVHSRYSTNTFPTWDLSQPFRFTAHNGEINTLRGNINWMHAREGLLESALLGDDINKIKPVIVAGGSDSAIIDNMFELLVLAGRTLPQAMSMLIPAAWENDRFLDQKLIDFYKYHACFMEPWDGPAAIAFTDGIRIGAVLDRNGLRPARYIITKQGFVVMASEVGVLNIDPGDIAVSGRLEPGKMFYIDTDEGRIVNDEEVKATMSSHRPYGVWLNKQCVELDDLPDGSEVAEDQEPIIAQLKAFGYSREELRTIITPMAKTGNEPTGSMGNDTPLAVLSRRPQLLYNYFKQLFAQVTNPPIDSIREDIVMSLVSFIGPQKNILGESPDHAHKLTVREPVLSNIELEKIRTIKQAGFRTKTISTLFKAQEPGDFLETIDRICAEAQQAIEENYSFIILSDRGTQASYAALPALLAMGAVHHYLVKRALRTQISIIVESAEPREVHHFALLFGYGADCINPYLAYRACEYLTQEGTLSSDKGEAVAHYKKALNKGLKKILSKMGISTLRSYRGAQIFEALGLHEEVIDKCFNGTASRISGAGFDELEQETLQRHREAFSSSNGHAALLAPGGQYQWREDGEFHLWNPETLSTVQDAARLNDYDKYKQFARLVNVQSENPTTLRSLLKFKSTTAIPLDEVEPVEEIFKRFTTGAMSFGSISKRAHETIAVAMNRIGGRSNTGEGGEDPMRFIVTSPNENKRSSTKQVASGRFGVTINYLVNADELQIKIAQGAKPGEGGQLPGYKVSALIARTRYTTPGVTLISPPPHHDIYSIEDLAQLIFDLKNTNPEARISVKLVSAVGVGTVAAGVVKGHADMILISGGDGGTGASPMSSIKHAGLPWELGLSETHQTLVLNDLRSRVRLQTDGQLRTGRDLAIAALLGAEEYGFGTVGLIIIGCVMLRHCHLNSCSVGVATQDDILQHRFTGRPKHLVNYFRFVAQEFREIMAQLGMRHIDEMIGRVDLLEVNQELVPPKAKHIDFTRILHKPEVPSSVGTHCLKRQDHGIDTVLDRKLIELTHKALAAVEPIRLELPIENFNRTTGAMLSGKVAKMFGEEGIPEDDTIYVKFTGVAGQSFGAWLAQGITFELEGLANDYIGKGISGGKIIVYPHKETHYEAASNIIIGNTTFYGAIRGEAYIRGVAGERFCIRNSGLFAVVEGVGDHGCEYMTGGVVVVLGAVGRNFAAGMSGGIAYVYDPQGKLPDTCNLLMVELEALNQEDKTTIHNLLVNHKKCTDSSLAAMLLDDFDGQSNAFIKVMPREYKRILEAKAVEQELDLLEAS
ncbi:MAG: glutamate synthase large subunit [Candidatus Marinimicrobia bacterium]|nr:glutamate synthase large subunit [Candidatus Neomarinimicrobiota bacterium]